MWLSLLSPEKQAGASPSSPRLSMLTPSDLARAPIRPSGTLEFGVCTLGDCSQQGTLSNASHALHPKQGDL